MDAVFLKLLNMSITASWLCLAILLIRLLLKKAPKAISCALWALVGLRLLLPFSLESVLSLVPSTQTLPEDILISPAPTINSGIPVVNGVVNPVISQGLAPNPGDSVNPMQVITTVAGYVWLVGMAAMLVYMLVTYLRVRAKVAEAAKIEGNVYECDHIDTPFILGVIRPRIYLPSSMNEADRAFVIAHEKAHLRRLDHLWKPLGFLLLTVYWFNPLLWLGYILLCHDIELACDEKVIKSLGTDIKKQYSEALINCSVPRRAISACPLAFGEVGVKGRIKSVLNYKKPAFWIILVAVVALVVTGVCFLTDPKTEDGKKIAYTADVIDVDNPLLLNRLKQTSLVTNDLAGYRLHKIQSVEQLNDYLVLIDNDNADAYAQKYDESFFKQHTLLTLYHPKSSDTDVFRIAEIRCFEECLKITVEKTTEGTAAAMIADLFFIELTTDDIQDCVQFEATFTYSQSLIDEIYATVQPDTTQPSLSFTAWDFITTPEIGYYSLDKANALSGTKFVYNGAIYMIDRTGKETELISGMPVTEAVFADLNQDGYPEFLGQALFGSGFIHEFIVVYDIKNEQFYRLDERFTFDFGLVTDTGSLSVTIRDVISPAPGATFAAIPLLVKNGDGYVLELRNGSDVLYRSFADGTHEAFLPEAIGSYVFSPDNHWYNDSIISLYEDQTFQFVFSPASSYLGYGKYEVKDDLLILSTDDGKYIYVFEMHEDRLVFIQTEDSYSEMGKFTNGSEFIKQNTN